MKQAIQSIWIICTGLFLMACEPLEQAGSSRVKRIITVQQMDTKFMELEDGARYGMGENLYNRLVSKLKEQDRFVVIVNESFPDDELPAGALGLIAGKNTKAKSAIEFDPSDRLHFNFAPISAADFSAEVQGLTFTHGTRGLTNFSGFRTNFHNTWNSGSFTSRNEFTPRSLLLTKSWFGTSFDPIGSGDFNTITGIDAGMQGEFNLIIASFHYRRDRFIANNQIKTRLKLLAENTIDEQIVEGKGKGFLFALGIGFRELSIEFGIVKNDSLKKTFEHSIDLMTDYLSDELFKIPFRTKVELIDNREGIIINAGRREGLREGDIFRHRNGAEILSLKVSEVFQLGAVMEVMEGNPSQLSEQDVVVWDEGASVNEVNEARIAKLRWWERMFVNDRYKPIASLKPSEIPDNEKVLARPNGARGFVALAGNDVANQTTIRKKDKKEIHFDTPEFSLPNSDASEGLSLKNTILLPYLLIRYAQYDQEVEQDLDDEPAENIAAKASAQWNSQSIQLAEAWQKHSVKGEGVKIAIIDSGVDYNHDNLHHSFDRENVGFDFSSFDERPFDDNSHGTAIAGIIAAKGIDDEPVGIAPNAQILAYKVFNPYGETTSAKIYGAFKRAIDDGADIIVAAWATKKDSAALRSAIELAQSRDILVVTAAGDRGENLHEFPNYPAVYNNLSNVISVGNLNQSGLLSEQLGRFSNYGIGLVDIGAPGEDLEVLEPRSNYLRRGGSDLAAAHVAGVAALVLSKQPNIGGTQLRSILQSSATNNPALVEKIQSGRMLNALTALDFIDLNTISNRD